jgi:hypothetical protein
MLARDCLRPLGKNGSSPSLAARHPWLILDLGLSLLLLAYSHSLASRVDEADGHDSRRRSGEGRSDVRRLKKRWLLVAAPTIVLLLVGASVTRNFFIMFLEPLGSTSSNGFSTGGVVGRGGTIDVYVPGAGFSGFFYTLGRLRSLHPNRDHRAIAKYNNTASSLDEAFVVAPPTEYEYYCFSAGCLAVVATLLDVPFDTSFELARSSRDRWATGEIGRYDVVEHFVDGLLSEGIDDGTREACDDYLVNSTGAREAEVTHCALQDTSHKMYLDGVLPRINVITSVWNRESVLSQRVEKPSDILHLKRLLLETTWIPTVTGFPLGNFNRNTGSHHNDGAFVGLLQNLISSSENDINLFEPATYHHSLLLPWNFELLSHSLNMLLSHDGAAGFYRQGLDRGVG